MSAAKTACLFPVRASSIDDLSVCILGECICKVRDLKLYLLHRVQIVLADRVGLLAQSFSDFEKHDCGLAAGQDLGMIFTFSRSYPNELVCNWVFLTEEARRNISSSFNGRVWVRRLWRLRT